MQQRIHLILSLGLMLSVMQLSAAGPDGDNRMPDRAEIEAALEECFSSLQSDSNGRPDHSAIDSCMSEKGYSKPSAPPGGMRGGERGSPPSDRY
jgi:hypothetical protein